MGSSLVQRNKVVARRKGTLAVVVAGTGAAAAVIGLPLIGVVGIIGGAVLGWNWVTFRIKHGMRF